MPESRSSADPAAKPPASHRDFSLWYVAAGGLAMTIGAGLFHPGAALLLLGLLLIAVGLFGGAR